MESDGIDFKLPDWNVPNMPEKRLTGDAYVAWLVENRLELIRSGLLEKLLADPNRCPVDVRFVLHD
ncbi:MAG: hypothetical protein WCD79_18920 [Chthoniobacteraceae bacterium]